MVYIASWDEFVDRSVRLFRNDPNTTRYVMKYRHCDGKLVLKVTDNKECLKFKTDQAQDARKMEKLNNIFFTLMSRGPDADIAEVTGKEQADAQQGKKGRGRKQSFLEIKDANDKKEFTQMIKAIKVRHNNVVPAMALRVQQLKKGMDPKILYEDLDEIHQFLDRFYLSRIGIRMLIGQHVKLHNPNPPPHVVGYIHTKMSPFDLQVISMEGYGTDAYLHLSRLGDSQEPLP